MGYQSQIDYELSVIKNWYQQNYPLCGFCGHRVKDGYGELAHLIRRSASRELQTLKLNTMLSHHECHDIFDNKPNEAVYLPRFYECLFIIWRIDLAYYGQMGNNYSMLGITFPDFFSIDRFIGPLEHHGQLLTLLPYLKKAP